jgi:hypothetical protein
MSFADKQGISKRFLEYFKVIDTKVGERTLGPDKTVSGKVQETAASFTSQAKSVDEQKGISKTFQEVSSRPISYYLMVIMLFAQYYEKALASPFGQKVMSFYTSTSKNVIDIHEEARRIAAQNKAATPPHTSGTPPAPTTQAAPTVV